MFQWTKIACVALWDPGFIKFQQELKHCPLDWKTTIQWNVVLTIFQLNHICQGCWKIVGPTFWCIIFLQSRGQGPKSRKATGQICPLISTRIRTLSLGLENYNTMKCQYDNFPAILTYVVMLENCQNYFSMNVCSPIQGTMFSLSNSRFNQIKTIYLKFWIGIIFWYLFVGRWSSVVATLGGH